MDDLDTKLLFAVANGNEAALRELMAKHKEPVFRFAYRFLQNEADAQEVTAETFVRVYRKAKQFRPQAKVSTWIFTIAANLCRDYARKAARRKVFSLSGWGQGADDEATPALEDQIADTQLNAAEAASLRETTARALAAIDALPAKLRAPFVLHVLEDHSQRDCAEILGISAKAVETRIYRARKQIVALV